MTAELAILIFIYAGLVMGVFLKPNSPAGLVATFKSTVPTLSARVERNVITGHGFWLKSSGWQGHPHP